MRLFLFFSLHCHNGGKASFFELVPLAVGVCLVGKSPCLDLVKALGLGDEACEARFLQGFFHFFGIFGILHFPPFYIWPFFGILPISFPTFFGFRRTFPSIFPGFADLFSGHFRLIFGSFSATLPALVQYPVRQPAQNLRQYACLCLLSRGLTFKV